MPRFIESIKYTQGRLEHVTFHQNRVNRTFEFFFPGKSPLQIKEKIQLALRNPGIQKCRLLYNEKLISISFQPYRIPNIRSLKLIEVPEINYDFKFEDRQILESAFSKKENCDDIIIVKNGMISDSSYANLCFFTGKKWLTPEYPLLAGTKRAQLIDQGLIEPAIIKVEDLHTYQHVCLINAMLDLGQVQVNISAIR